MRKKEESSYPKKSESAGKYKKNTTREQDNKGSRSPGKFGPKERSERGENSFGRAGNTERPSKSFDKKSPRRDDSRRDDDRPKRTFRKDDDKPSGADSRKKSFGEKSFDRKDTRPFPKKEGKFAEKESKYADRKGDKFADRKEGKFTERKGRFNEDAGSERPARKPFDRTEKGDRTEDKRSFKKDGAERKPFSKDAEGKKPFRKDREDKPFNKEAKPFSKSDTSERKFTRSSDRAETSKRFNKRPFKKERSDTDEHDVDSRKAYSEDKPSRNAKEDKSIGTPMTLNKYISHSGECSRRDAAEFVKQGKVRVNGELILEPGYRVVPGDQVTLSGKKLTPQKGLIYVLLNKPKGFITTTEDPEDRKTVMDLVTNTGADRLFPVGRLDRNTTGLLLLTNDGALAHKLAHPSYNIKKIYHVTLDKNLVRADYEKIVKGLELEDGKAQVDALAYLENRNELGLEIHSGRNRIVRRIFESLGYEVEKLDRVMYAGLTKKNLPRGKWRLLNEREIVLLKHFKS